MHIPKNTLIAVYDALHELAHFAYPQWLQHARTLGEGLGTMGLGTVARSGSPVTAAVLTSAAAVGASAIVISPAATEVEHLEAFRLPQLSLPTIYSGRGALGADVTVLTSAKAVLVIGDDEEALRGILGCADGHGICIAVLCADAPDVLHKRLLVRYPSLSRLIFVSTDPQAVVKYLVEESRKRHMQEKLQS